MTTLAAVAMAGAAAEAMHYAEVQPQPLLHRHAPFQMSWCPSSGRVDGSA